MAWSGALPNPQWRHLGSSADDWREVQWRDGRWTATSAPVVIEVAYALTRWAIADLPPMPDAASAAHLAARIGERYREVDWRAVGELSAEAALLQAHWTLREWRAFGHRRLRREEDHLGLDALLSPPICVGPDGWAGGTLLATLVIRAGAAALAAEDPNAERSYLSPLRE
jgi:hypothetical protein